MLHHLSSRISIWALVSTMLLTPVTSAFAQEMDSHPSPEPVLADMSSITNTLQTTEITNTSDELPAGEEMALFPLQVPAPAEEVAVAAEMQQASNVMLEFRVLEVKALDETNPEWPGSDDIFLGGTSTSRYGTTKIEYSDLGGFDDGDSRKYDNPPWVFRQFLIADYPQAVAVTLSLIEEDGKGKEKYLEELVNYQRAEIAAYVNRETSTMAAADAALITSAAVDPGTALEAILIAALQRIVKETSDDFIEWIIGRIKDFFQDDFFTPAVLTMQINSPNVRWPGGATTSPRGEWRFVGHGGTYRIIYDWNLVLPPVPSVQAAESTDGSDELIPDEAAVSVSSVDGWFDDLLVPWWYRSPWRRVTNRFPVFWWTRPLRVKTNGPVNVVAKHSGKCLDVKGVRLGNGAPFHQWDCIDASQGNQLFTFKPVGYYYQIIASHSRKCLDVSGASIDEGAIAHQWDCLGSQQMSQLWTVRPVGGAYQIIAAHSGQCLDVAGTDKQNGAEIRQWECISNIKADQLWYLVPPKHVPPQQLNKIFLPIVR